jgi:adenylate cyclase class IV
MNYKDLMKNSFLVRKCIEKDKISSYLIYKNKVINENEEVILEEKIRVNIDDVNKTVKIFENANITNWCSLNNLSIVFYNDKMHFAIQCIEGLGNFIEYEEDETMKDLMVEDKRALMIKRVKELGLSLANDYSVKKPFMMLHK